MQELDRELLFMVVYCMEEILFQDLTENFTPPQQEGRADGMVPSLFSHQPLCVGGSVCWGPPYLLSCGVVSDAASLLEVCEVSRTQSRRGTIPPPPGRARGRGLSSP